MTDDTPIPSKHRGQPWRDISPSSLATPRIVTFPDGRQVRGRGLATQPNPLDDPEYGLYLLDEPPDPFAWLTRWALWPDYGIPPNATATVDALYAAFQLAPFERVEIGCAGGRGRTGCAIGIMAAWAGVEPTSVIAWTRENYHPDAIETPEQEQWLLTLCATIASPSTW